MKRGQESFRSRMQADSFAKKLEKQGMITAIKNPSASDIDNEGYVVVFYYKIEEVQTYSPRDFAVDLLVELIEARNR